MLNFYYVVLVVIALVSHCRKPQQSVIIIFIYTSAPTPSCTGRTSSVRSVATHASTGTCEATNCGIVTVNVFSLSIISPFGCRRLTQERRDVSAIGTAQYRDTERNWGTGYPTPQPKVTK